MAHGTRNPGLDKRPLDAIPILDWLLSLPERFRDIDPAIIRAQCAADPVRMAREIVRAKIGAGLKFTVNGAGGRHSTAEWQAKLDAAR